jgi:hypothetical protein
MNITSIQSRTVKTYTLAVDDGEVRDQPYTRTGRRYRVERITVVKRDGNCTDAELSGPVLKKDGSDGANWTRESLYRQGDWPEWLSSAIKGLA